MTPIAERAVAAHKHVAANGLAEHFNPQHVSQDLLGLSVEVGMDEGDVIVGGDAVAEGTEPLRARDEK